MQLKGKIGPQSIEQLADLTQSFLIAFIGVAEMPNRITAIKSVLCLSPVVQACGEKQLKQHAIIEGYRRVA